MARKRLFPQSARRGAILAAVLVCLFFATLLGLALVKLVVMHHRQRTRIAHQEQCFWLAESGLQRALAHLARSPEYRGETWTVPGEVFGVELPGTVTIEVTEASAPEPGRKIRVEACFPDDPVRRTVFQREQFVPLAAFGGSS